MSYTAAPKDQPEREAVVKQALLNAAERLQISQSDLAEIIGVSESKISRLRHDAKSTLPRNAKEYELALLLIRLFRSLDAIVGGNEENVQRWFHAYNQHLDGVPAALVKKATGLVAVVNYLDAMRGKL